ncbi:hypothetical protein L3X38_005632 [Prunus dulcis]|uniref:Transmembrane protein n=1 Tax=Prunus dulcis TaxID=3755 RepID=A0AAD4ZRB0_PRUDU|nr:hypothetical protein L3X38_005632 [Prunus dulcis]
MAAPSAPLNLCTVLNESKRIVNAHSRHFLALSVLFLLPLCFSSIVYPTVQNLLNEPSPNNSKIFLQISTFNPHQHQPIIATKPLCIALSFFLFIFVFSLCAVCSITYSVFHGFYGRPVKLISAINSVLFSFFPLLGTVLVSQILVLLVFTVFGLVLVLVVRGAELMGFQMEYNSPYFIGFLAVLAMALFLVLLYLQVNWTLASVVVVVESNWGFGSLTRSTNLIKGMRGVALSMMLFFGFFLSILGFCSWASALDLDGDTDGWKSWAFVVQIVVTSTSLMLLMLYNTAANAVLYMYCRALNGELAMEIAEEFATEYVSLPFDDGKVPHLVSVAYT